MDKSVIFAVAGSGKTTRLVTALDEVRRFLLVTYTEANYDNLRAKVIGRFGYLPPNIAIYTYFSFLHSFCYRPFLRSKKNTRGITFKAPDRFPVYPLTNDRRYISPGGWLYANRLAKFIEQSGLVGAVLARMEKYFDVFCVDEVQDFGGHDFNFLLAISEAQMDMNFVGDFYQHTFDTSRDGNVNSNLHKNYDAYRKKFERARLKVDTDSLKCSRRCSKSVCDFITEKIGVNIQAHDERTSVVRFEDDPAAVATLYQDPGTVKLFYKEHQKYGCFSQNWGASKGMDRYEDVCVVLNPGNVKAWNAGSFRDINPETRNKLYVACSRARGNLTFVPESLLKVYKRS
ncbi:DNA helicase UvrD [Achromobacter ruhlandii]|uniref:DNA helicase UvrD n=1 Tax=Achromobacter ruhlandii TaxID=72557 RepID=UPI0021F1AD32|nr:DNA helicase UvrD [Achromobacter ruhlandii]MCV6795657.1 DNA helicase UvrD [Achromobacter ruhlandii]MCV6800605.1 DNA helicase UvrD [Achromobacter ruhlandii]MCV6807297.1 DNA helicase UvrD [Achromobacter ruhlandii]MCV6817592.1 DNA helicase UvrD [Achromobacter ruhlandii]